MHDVLGPDDLSPGRYPGEGGPRGNGGLARDAGAHAGPSGGGVRVVPAVAYASASRRGKMAHETAAGPLRAPRPDGSTEDRIRHPDRPVAAWATARLGGG